jgi:uncharacterized DUF497 family protein
LSTPQVLGFAFDDENSDKIARHGLSERQVLQVLENEFLLLRNRKERRASYLVIGQDHGGACIAIPIEPTYDEVIWRPVTAWPCKGSERAKLKSSL